MRLLTITILVFALCIISTIFVVRWWEQERYTVMPWEDAPEEAATWKWQIAKPGRFEGGPSDDYFQDAHEYYFPVDSWYVWARYCTPTAKGRPFLRKTPVETASKIFSLLERQRYPYEWWGHFYRPEVWIALLTSLGWPMLFYFWVRGDFARRWVPLRNALRRRMSVVIVVLIIAGVCFGAYKCIMNHTMYTGIILPWKDAPMGAENWAWRKWGPSPPRYSSLGAEPDDERYYWADRYKLKPDSEEILNLVGKYSAEHWTIHFRRWEIWLTVVSGLLLLWQLYAWLWGQSKSHPRRPNSIVPRSAS